MADIQNASFELPDTEHGQAQDWDEAYNATGEDVGQFWNGERYLYFEGFEGGFDDNENGQTAFADTDLEVGLFESGTNPVEPFEYSWALPKTGPPFNHQSETTFYPGNFAVGEFDAGVSEDVEDFEEEWQSNEDAVADFAAATSVVGYFDGTPEDVEDFEEEWRSNENSVADFDAASSSAGMFDTGTPEAVEDFEEEWTMTLP
jgi:hypothetical protein